MPIEFGCRCGKRFRVKDELAGKKAKCPQCQQIIQIPIPAAPREESQDTYDFADDQPAAKPAAAPMPAPKAMPTPAAIKPLSSAVAKKPAVAPNTPNTAGLDYQATAPGNPRRFAYLLLLLALIPLGLSMLHPRADDIKSRLKLTMQHHPEIIEKIEAIESREDASESDFFNALPEHRIEGSLLARDSWMHWPMALISSALFTMVVILIFPHSTDNLKKLLLTGLFTATAGIFMLLAFQWIAGFTQGFWIRGRGIVVLLFYIVKFVGFSYRAALDPETNFWLSAMGFTFGVGLCEELCKALPVLVEVSNPQKNRWPWRIALLVGLMSGVGFGVSEGIHYSSDMYNGLSRGDAYLVRFVSCVALHAVWSGAGAVVLFRKSDKLISSEGFLLTAFNAVALLIVPILLHGFYDTLLKKDMELWALLVAILSFAYLAMQIEQASRHENDPEPGARSRIAPIPAGLRR